MTNGEKLRETFPNVRIIEFESYICVMGENYEFNNAYPKKWWNAEYKEPSNSENPNKSEKPISSTIKNGISNRTIIYKAKESKDIQEDLEKLEKLNEPTTKNDLGVEKIVDVLGSYTDLDIPYKHKIAKDILNNLSSVTPIRPKGHWIEHPHEAGPNWEYSRYECSECHAWAEDDSDYCPYCGADMRGEEE